MTQGNDPTVSFLFKTGRYVNQLTGVNPVHTLVGIGIWQWALGLNVRAHLYIIQRFSPETIRQFLTARIPGGLEPGGMYTVSEAHHLLRFTVTAHKADTGHITAIAFQQAVKHIVIKRVTYIILQLGAMAAWTAIRTLGEVKR